MEKPAKLCWNADEGAGAAVGTGVVGPVGANVLAGSMVGTAVVGIRVSPGGRVAVVGAEVAGTGGGVGTEGGLVGDMLGDDVGPVSCRTRPQETGLPSAAYTIKGTASYRKKPLTPVRRQKTNSPKPTASVER